MPAENITITAQWTEKPTEYVEIVFEKKDISEDEARAVIRKYTDEEFVIVKIETDEETGEVRVIAKFDDVAKSEEFVRNINGKKIPETTFIKRVNGARSEASSISLSLVPPSFLSNLILF